MATTCTHLLSTAAGALLLLSPTALSAQEIQQEDILPEIGATWHMRALQTIPDVPPDELPMVWPFAGLVGNDVFGIRWTMLSPDAVPVSVAYPGTDRVLRRQPDDNSPIAHTFLDVAADKVLELATATPTVTSTFDPGGLYTAFPLAYNAPVEAQHCFTSASSTALNVYCGRTEVIFLRSGLLQLNFGEFPNARLVRTRRSTVSQLLPADSIDTETLTWYTDGLPYPLLQLITVHYPDGTASHSGYILDPGSVVGMEQDAQVTNLPMYPVPSAGEVNIHATNGGELDIYSMDGRLVYNTRLIATATPVRTDLSVLAPGTYRAVLREKERILSSTFILAR